MNYRVETDATTALRLVQHVTFLSMVAERGDCNLPYTDACYPCLFHSDRMSHRPLRNAI
jgi:hypothetical protein